MTVKSSMFALLSSRLCPYPIYDESREEKSDFAAAAEYLFSLMLCLLVHARLG